LLRSMEISPSLEDYLKAILYLKKENGMIRVTDLAQKLQVAKASVNQAVTKLTARKMVIHERYGPLELTVLGLKQAQKITERHQFLKCFFTEVLGVESQIAEQDACMIEHYISPATLQKLNNFLTASSGWSEKR
jgi:DtxR family Mn-dependent transcriptional regulator